MGYDDDFIWRMREFERTRISAAEVERFRERAREIERIRDEFGHTRIPAAETERLRERAREIERIRSEIGSDSILNALALTSSPTQDIVKALGPISSAIGSDSILNALALASPPASLGEGLGSIALLREIESQAALASRVFDASTLRTWKTEVALLAEQQRQLREMPWGELGSATRFGAEAIDRVGARFTEFVGTYHSLIQHVAEEERLAALNPTLLWTVPHFEVRASAFALEAVLPYPQTDEYAERSYDFEGEPSLEELLADLGPDFVRPWQGAKQSLQSRNVDRQRHVSTSIRELLTQVLHKLAPDERVRSWSSDPKHYHDGRPTRSARLEYISRGSAAARRGRKTCELRPFWRSSRMQPAHHSTGDFRIGGSVEFRERLGGLLRFYRRAA